MRSNLYLREAAARGRGTMMTEESDAAIGAVRRTWAAVFGTYGEEMAEQAAPPLDENTADLRGRFPLLQYLQHGIVAIHGELGPVGGHLLVEF